MKPNNKIKIPITQELYDKLLLYLEKVEDIFIDSDFEDIYNKENGKLQVILLNNDLHFGICNFINDYDILDIYIKYILNSESGTLAPYSRHIYYNKSPVELITTFTTRCIYLIDLLDNDYLYIVENNDIYFEKINHLMYAQKKINNEIS